MSDPRASRPSGADVGKRDVHDVPPIGASRATGDRKQERPEERAGGGRTNSLAAIGFEAEFVGVINGEQVKPEDVFKSPANIVRAPMMHRAHPT